MNSSIKTLLFRTPLLLALYCAAGAASAQTTLTINSLGDDPALDPESGNCSTGDFINDEPPFILECTLRAAIEAANEIVGPVEIEISSEIGLTAGNTSIVSIATALPFIDNQVTIAGDTHPQYGAEGAVYFKLRGPGSGNFSGLRFSAGGAGSVVRGIGIENFGNNAILISGGDNYVIDSNILGGSWGVITYAYMGNGGQGLDIRASSGNQISDNVIVGSGDNGIRIGNGSASNAVQGNIIGLSKSSTGAETRYSPAVGSQNGGNGIHITSSAGSGNAVGFSKGNTISHNDESGVLIEADGQVVLANAIGIPHNDEPDSQFSPGSYGNGVHGIQIKSSNNAIGASPSLGNIIGHSQSFGIVIGDENAAAANDNEIMSNWIGTNADGDDVGMEIGIQILSGANSVVSNNRISNNNNGFVNQGESGAFIRGNTITDNQFAGAYFAAPGQLGTLDPGQPNIIGNNYVGVLVQAYETANTTALVLIRNNLIGTDGSGTTMGNEFGIVVETEFNRVEIGQINDTGNTIVNNETGIFLNGAHDTEVVGNLIGVHPDGTPMGNGTAALILGGSIGNQIGYAADESIDSGTWSPGTGTANVIAHNDAGIRFSTIDDTSYGNTIRGNRIHANGSTSTPGIDLGMTALDVGGGGTGPNTLLNYPDFDANATGWDAGTGQLDYRYRVQTVPANADYPMTIDFYLTDGNSPQGLTYIGSETYPESASFEFRTGSLSITQPVNASTYLVATATDASGNTSQFTHQPFPLVVSDVLFSDRFEGP